MIDFVMNSERDLDAAADWFIERAGSAKVFAFRGEMGSGKTTFIKTICQKLGVKEIVSSPSFALVYEYFSQQAGIIYHFDLYRIREVEELFDIGYEDYVYSGNLCFIEWPEIALHLLPEDVVRVEIEIMPDKTRKITLYE